MIILILTFGDYWSILSILSSDDKEPSNAEPFRSGSRYWLAFCYFNQPDALPDQYGLNLTGDCMAPLLPDGATIACSRTAPYQRGDLVVLWFRPQLVELGHQQCFVKRLLMLPPDFVKFPHRDNPGSEALPVVIVKMLNPRAYGWVECAKLLAIHKVLGTVPSGKGRQVSMAELRAVSSPAKQGSAHHV